MTEPVFRLWGGLSAELNGASIDLRQAREQRMLVALLAAKRSWTARESLCQWIWDEPPESAPNELHHLARALRRELAKLGLDDVVQNKSGGWQLDILPTSVDAHLVDHLISARKHDDMHASALLAEALRLCKGTPLAGIAGERIESFRTTMKEARRRAMVRFYQVELRLGHCRERVGELLALFPEYLGDMNLTALLIVALWLDGRQHEALATFQQYRENLCGHSLPFPREMNDLHTRLLNDGLTATSGGFPLGDPIGGSTVDKNGQLTVAVRPESGIPEEIKDPVAKAFTQENVDCPIKIEDDCVICVVPVDVERKRVVGVWMAKLAKAIDRQASVGISLAGEENARELALSERARAALGKAARGRLAIALSDDVRHLDGLESGRRVDLHEYKRAGDTDEWVRVVQHDRSLQEPVVGRNRASVGKVSSSGHTVTLNNSPVGKQVTASVINNSQW
ncbi:DNA-binding SARP family transcriptional activator [Kibdelosporangium banguiense]|uniref:DNA-binding SARP family transcriptional activator n=1 Tax=Kibdelosporangium banguiense TaxID=1365924 RepID=A0ABS4TPJ3_9PSEU|nr:BTAD domain-containing putative transcriptional regulator [Kibdelosporangium banguiense]MBP2326317.1 DNA-binding SARP family transcriptional activator [Kibdelosporangium banguiense]